MKYAVEDTRMKAIANAVRAKTGKTDTMTVDEIPTEVAAVYDKAIDDMWEMIQQGGNRTDYRWAFFNQYLDDKIFKPKYKITPVGEANYIFSNTFRNSDTTINLTSDIFDSSQCTYMAYGFFQAAVKYIEVLDVSNVRGNTGLYQTFYSASNKNALERIDKFIISEDTSPFFLTFQLNFTLSHCVFEGIIANNGLTVNTCPLDHESLLSVVNCLKDYSADTSGTVWKVTLGATNLAKLTADEKAIATGKGWILE